ncbi:MAG TPA: EAL domain-containing protein [Frankiaceae bacterium]|jgi:diguanylate cyclase (GGDEF)-like protein|nr:EAL domain-containing protein [Frankiaceae bacterium]
MRRRPDRSHALPAPAVALAAFTMIVSAVVLLSPIASTRFGWYFDDLGALAVSAGAAVGAIWRSRRSSNRALRRSWILIAIGCSSWAIGEALWCWFELGQGKDPFPSVADIGYLGFPLAAGAALLCYPASQGFPRSGQRMLDSLVAVGSLGLISWETVLRAVSGSPADSAFAFTISLTYPLTDLVVLMLVVLTLARAPGSKLALALIAAGCASLAVSDSLFAYLTATTGYTGGAVDLGWIAAFVLLGLASVAPDRSPSTGPLTEADKIRESQASLLNYLPVIAAVGVTLALAAAGHAPTVLQLGVAASIISVMLLRQYLASRRNAELATALARREAQLRHQAFHDGLTGLANRGLFQDRLAHALELHRRDLRPVSVLFFDLDDFKLVNDSLGHRAGDELLGRVAERITGAVRTGDTAARLGGDEFAVLIEDSGDPVALASRIVDALRAPFVLDGTSVEVRASIGVFELAADDVPTTADQLLINADTAMYAAKRSGKDRIVIYRNGMSLAELEDGELARALRAAIEARELNLAYQPIVDLATGKANAVEALTRWVHLGENVPPAVFIPMAERCGVMDELTAYVLGQACEQLSEWGGEVGHQHLSIAVNVPPAQITSPGFVTLVTDLVRRHELAAGQLVIEITESGAFEEPEAARTAIAEMRRHGVAISLDDFGVGQSSLAQLHSVELDSIKIDKSFIDTLDSNPRQAQFLRALLRLSYDIDVKVIVEGIERPEQLTQLLELGHPLAQGFLFARPMTPAECLPLLTGDAKLFGAAPAGALPRQGTGVSAARG